MWTASALEFSTFEQTNGWAPVLGTPSRYLTGGGAFEVGAHLPQGALGQMIEVEGCTTSGGQIDVDFIFSAAPGGGGQLITSFAGFSDTPGCAVFQNPLASPFAVDNKNTQYLLQIGNSPADGSTYVSAVRVYYQLQVSPPPQTATFNDVAVGSPYFQFIEALNASAITAGCSAAPPLYCPDAPVTRAQMAVFLSKALGLYWPE